MDIERIKELFRLLEESEIDDLEISVKDKGGEISIRKGTPEGTTVMQSVPSPAAGAPVQANPPAPAGAEVLEKAEKTPAGIEEITSPIVGTFYRAPSPEAEPYVEIGDHIETGQVVCIVEAMKIMNEIQAEISGSVEKILVKNGDPVEFGQVLFHIKPE